MKAEVTTVSTSEREEMKLRVTEKVDPLLHYANNCFITQTVKHQREQMELQQRQMERGERLKIYTNDFSRVPYALPSVPLTVSSCQAPIHM